MVAVIVLPVFHLQPDPGIGAREEEGGRGAEIKPQMHRGRGTEEGAVGVGSM